MNDSLLKRVEAEGGSGRVEVCELAKLANVRLAWRPWPRRWLTEREQRLLSGAVASSGCEIVGNRPIPHSLRAYVLLTPSAPSVRSRRARWAHVTWATAIKLGGLIGFVAALVTLWPLLFPASRTPRRLAGGLNFAILTFQASPQSQDGQRAAEVLSRTFATSLRDALERGDPELLPDVQVLDYVSPSSTDPPGESRLLAALAKRVGADALVYGNVREESSTTVTPRVYVAPKELPGASEFAGTYPLGDSIRLPVALTDSAPATGLVRQALTNRAAGLASFIDAVGYLSLERFSDAVRYLQAASRSTGWQGPKAQGLLELFLGNATAKLPQSQKVRLDKAEGFYRAALGHIPRFTRARLGLAEVAFQRAHGNCTKQDVDRAGLERTLAQFNSVLKASAQAEPPEQSLLAAKARFGLGRIYLCQSQAELAARWPDAERELVAVTTSYRNDDLLRDDAAEAFGDLAIVALPGSRVRDRRDAYITAEAFYSHAIKLTRDPTSLPALHANRAFVETRLGERAAAEADEQTAAHLQKQAGGPH